MGLAHHLALQWIVLFLICMTHALPLRKHRHHHPEHLEAVRNDHPQRESLNRETFNIHPSEQEDLLLLQNNKFKANDRHQGPKFQPSQDIAQHREQLVAVQRLQVASSYDFPRHVKCGMCKVIVTLVHSLLAQGRTQDDIATILTHVCIKLQIESRRICVAVIKEFRDEVFAVLMKLALSPAEVCGLSLGPECAHTYDPFLMWNVTLPPTPKPPVKPPVPPKSTSPKVRILQLSDIHLDMEYKVGSNANCGEPLCCHEDDGTVNGEPAGLWGDYRHCDTPQWTLENLFKHLATKEKFDLIYWTGDLPNHKVWNQTRVEQQELEAYLTRLLLKYFPKTPIFPSIGNHESAPTNSFPPPFIKGRNSIQWLYQTLASNWSVWLPRETQADILKGGYYTVRARPGLRIVSLNTNYCSNENWWLLLNTTDPANQLQWLIQVLQAAENKGEKVHILGHMPPGISTCLQAWSWNFYKIISRYESTVTAMFFGHTHYDSFTVFYDDVTLRRPVSIAYVCPSVTPFVSEGGFNPAYRIYEVDGGYPNASWVVLNHYTFISNLTEANRKASKSLTWDLEYDAKTAFNMKNLYAADWHELIDRMDTDPHLFSKYYRYYYHSHPPEGSCDQKCRVTMLCEARSGRSYDAKELCKDL